MGMDKQTKYKPSMGLAFNEEREMEMLSKMAREGWIFYSFSNLGYKFKKGEPRNLIYCMDTHNLKGEDREQYFNLFNDAGWTHVNSVGNSMHFFSAPEGTKPIYTDNSTLVEKYRKGRRDVFKGAGVFSAAFIIFFLLQRFVVTTWDNKTVSVLVAAVTGFSFGMTLAMIITGFVMGAKVKKLCK